MTNICEHPDIKAVSFVGGNEAGEYIYRTSSYYGKRCQSNMGAKNHAIVMGDADKEDAINALIGACYGSTGQRCMAISVVVMVGDSADWIPEIVEKSKKLTVGRGADNYDIAPVVTKGSLDRILGILEKCDTDGSTIALDGRNIKVEGSPNGNWLGPTIIDNAKPGMAAYDQEIFGPVMVICRVETLDEAIKLINSN